MPAMVGRLCGATDFMFAAARGRGCGVDYLGLSCLDQRKAGLDRGKPAAGATCDHRRSPRFWHVLCAGEDGVAL
jgi:hypothetical protein